MSLGKVSFAVVYFSLVKKLLKSFKCSFRYYLCKEDTSKKALTQKLKNRNSADIYIFFSSSQFLTSLYFNKRNILQFFYIQFHLLFCQYEKYGFVSYRPRAYRTWQDGCGCSSSNNTQVDRQTDRHRQTDGLTDRQTGRQSHKTKFELSD